MTSGGRPGRALRLRRLTARLRGGGNVTTAGEIGNRYALLALADAPGGGDAVWASLLRADAPGYGWID
jgi:hypothetical protein